MKFLLVTLLIAFAFASSLHAANQYVRAAAAGTATGADWTNAFTALPATTVRGDTYYIAGGTYAAMTLNAVAGTSVTSVKGATVADHGTSTGWSDAYAVETTPAKWTRSTNGSTIDLRLSYVTFNGSLTGASTAPNKTQRGLIFENTATTGSSNIVIYNQNGTVASHATFINCQFNGVNNGAVDGGTMFFNEETTTDLIVQYCYFNQASQFWIKTRDVVNQSYEYNWFRNCGSGNAGLHSAGVITDATQSINATVRYNVFENLLPATGSSAYIEPQNNGHTGTPAQLYIYGNIFWATDAAESYSPGLVALTGGDSFATLLFYNNTIYGSHGANPGVFGTANATGWLATNNVWQACDFTPTFPSVTDTTNTKNTGGVTFVDTATGNFRLTGATTAGTTLGSPYNADMDGVTRGSDGTWDRGAFEFVGSGGTTGLGGTGGIGGRASIR